MTVELNELNLLVGQRRVGRVRQENDPPGSFSEPVSLRQNGIQVVRSRKFKRTTDSDDVFNIAPNLLQQDFAANGPNQRVWGGTLPTKLVLIDDQGRLLQ